MKKLDLARLTPGRFDVQVLGPANTTSLTIDENNAVHATMRHTGDKWMLFGIVDAVKLTQVSVADEFEPPVRKK